MRKAGVILMAVCIVINIYGYYQLIVHHEAQVRDLRERHSRRIEEVKRSAYELGKIHCK